MTEKLKVYVKIESYIENLDDAGIAEGDGERSKSFATGVYEYSGEMAILSYSESDESGKSDTVIRVEGETVTVCRSGAITSELRFKEGESHSSIYSVAPYSFDATVKARRVRINLNEEGGQIDLIYNMKIGGAEKSARMKIWILQASNQT